MLDNNMDNYSELLHRSAQKDQLAFKRLYEETSSRLYALALRIVKRQSLAEEVLQETYLKIWTRAKDYSIKKGGAIGWMLVITRNTAIDTLRMLSRKPQETDVKFEDFNFVRSDTNLPLDKTVDYLNQFQHMAKQLQKLPAKQRQCILFSYYYGYSHNELSKMMNTPLGTIKSWLRRQSLLMLDSATHQHF